MNIQELFNQPELPQQAKDLLEEAYNVLEVDSTPYDLVMNSFDSDGILEWVEDNLTEQGAVWVFSQLPYDDKLNLLGDSMKNTRVVFLPAVKVLMDEYPIREWMPKQFKGESETYKEEAHKRGE